MALVSRAAVVCVLVTLAPASTALAGKPGQWTKVHDADGNTTEVGLARSGNGLLNVLWSRDADNAVLNTRIAANGSTVIDVNTIPTPYNVPSGGVNNSVALAPAPGGGLRAFFAGLSPDHPLDQRMATATSSDGATWFVQPTPASDDRTGLGSPVYVAQGIGGTIASNGIPVSIWGDSSPGAAGYHVGTSSTDPDIHFGGPSATVGSPNVATDSVSGQLVIAWNDLDARRTLVQSIAPAGARVNTPGGQAPDALERVGMATRAGGGTFIAYLRGTNAFDSKMAVWRFGAGKPMVLSPKNARFPGVAQGLGGRLWAFWVLQKSNYRIFAARSNQAATQFGARIKLKPPPGANTVNSVEGEGTAPGGALDLVALAQRNNGDNANYHQRIRPGLTLLAKRLGNGQVRFRTLDAGDPLAATVTFTGKTKPTGPDGEVVLAGEPGKTSKATATKNGYHPASRRVKVK